MPPSRKGQDQTDRHLDALVEVALPAVRTIVGVALRSLAASPVPVTMAQYRVLVTVAQLGPERAAAVAGTNVAAVQTPLSNLPLALTSFVGRSQDIAGTVAACGRRRRSG